MPWWGWLLTGMAALGIIAVFVSALVVAEGRDWMGEDDLPGDIYDPTYLGEQPNLPNELRWPKEPHVDPEGRGRDHEPRGA